VERDKNYFPDNPLGNTVWQAVNKFGEEVINQQLEIEFSVLFPSEQQALKFGQLLLENGQKLSFSTYEANPAFPWEITAYPTMPFSVENIMAYQQLLEQHCTAFEGQYDGWYCPALELGLE